MEFISGMLTGLIAGSVITAIVSSRPSYIEAQRINASDKPDTLDIPKHASGVAGESFYAAKEIAYTSTLSIEEYEVRIFKLIDNINKGAEYEWPYQLMIHCVKDYIKTYPDNEREILTRFVDLMSSYFNGVIGRDEYYEGVNDIQNIKVYDKLGNFIFEDHEEGNPKSYYKASVRASMCEYVQGLLTFDTEASKLRSITSSFNVEPSKLHNLLICVSTLYRNRHLNNEDADLQFKTSVMKFFREYDISRLDNKIV